MLKALHPRMRHDVLNAGTRILVLLYHQCDELLESIIRIHAGVLLYGTPVLQVQLPLDVIVLFVVAPRILERMTAVDHEEQDDPKHKDIILEVVGGLLQMLPR